MRPGLERTANWSRSHFGSIPYWELDANLVANLVDKSTSLGVGRVHFTYYTDIIICCIIDVGTKGG